MPEANPNGLLANIAGILNEGRNVLGMMPHPDRSSESILGVGGWSTHLPIDGDDADGQGLKRNSGSSAIYD